VAHAEEVAAEIPDLLFLPHIPYLDKYVLYEVFGKLGDLDQREDIAIGVVAIPAV
jgi:hypothetical protein